MTANSVDRNEFVPISTLVEVSASFFGQTNSAHLSACWSFVRNWGWLFVETIRPGDRAFARVRVLETEAIKSRDQFRSRIVRCPEPGFDGIGQCGLREADQTERVRNTSNALPQAFR